MQAQRVLHFSASLEEGWTVVTVLIGGALVILFRRCEASLGVFPRLISKFSHNDPVVALTPPTELTPPTLLVPLPSDELRLRCATDMYNHEFIIFVCGCMYKC